MFDLNYATIPILNGEEHTLYKESRFINMVTKAHVSTKFPIYGKDCEFSYLILEEDELILK